HRDPRQVPGLLRAGQGLCGDVLIHDRARFGVIDAKIDLTVRRAPIYRRDDDTRELTSPVNGGGFPPVLQDGNQMIAGPQPDFIESSDQGGNLRIPRPIGEPYVAVDNRQGFGIALDAGDKARTEIKHGCVPRSVCAPPPVPLSRWSRNRCIGTNGRRGTRGFPALPLSAARATTHRATSGCPAYRIRIATHSVHARPPAAARGDRPAPIPRPFGLRRLPPGPPG